MRWRSESRVWEQVAGEAGGAAASWLTRHLSSWRLGKGGVSTLVAHHSAPRAPPPKENVHFSCLP